jgi:serine protease inhibitor
MNPCVWWACVCGLVMAGCRPASSPVAVANAAGAATATNRFGFDLYDELRKTPGNLIFSPASAEVALAMASAGARGDTLDEMANVLRVVHLDDAHASFGSLLDSLNGRDGDSGVTIHVANRLWGQAGTAFRPAFLAVMSARYRAPLGAVDFAHAPEAAGAAINAWAAHETHDRITDIIEPGGLPTKTRLVLANAVYFKGAWKLPFETSATTDEDFTTPSAKVKVRMMHQHSWLSYAQIRSAQVVEMPYLGGFTMVVVLPDAADGLAAIEGRVGDEYDGWIAKLRQREVDLKLPQWKTTSSFDLVPPLEALGMKQAFTDGANFSGMSDLTLKIDQVRQKAFVESNEKGTEAAAVTVVGAVEVSEEEPPPPPPAVFHADHPFLYVIRDPTTGAVLFIGREIDPR